MGANGRGYGIAWFVLLSVVSLVCTGCDGDSGQSEDVCEGIDCSGNGVCVSLNGQAVCRCDPCYRAEGLTCVLETDPCQGVDCSGHGTCYWGAACQPVCQCDPGYELYRGGCALPWDKRVDEFWGEAPNLESRLATFDFFWEQYSAKYACFSAFDIDWDDSRDHYRPLVEQAESYGRFFQVLEEMIRGLMDAHSKIYSYTVCDPSALEERPPLYIECDVQSYLGACVTPVDSGELVVTRVDPDSNPLGLAPGDLVIGYDGKTWSSLLDEIATWKIPHCPCRYLIPTHGTALEAHRIIQLGSVVNNAHLFDSIEVQRYGQTEVESFATGDLLSNMSSLVCTDQVPVDGVDFPFTKWTEYDGVQDRITNSWGILPGTNVGYIYVYSFWDTSWGRDGGILQFIAAVEELAPITDGLIIDQRFMMGGVPLPGAFPLLFNQDHDYVLHYAPRDPNSQDRNALDLRTSSGVLFKIDADESTFYDHPIAVLTGPKAWSGGDLFPYAMSFHPRVRKFGRITNGAFSGCDFLSRGDLKALITIWNAVDQNGVKLQAWDQQPEELVWLTRDNIANGIDDVAAAALAWIEQENSR